MCRYSFNWVTGTYACVCAVMVGTSWKKVLGFLLYLVRTKVHLKISFGHAWFVVVYTWSWFLCSFNWQGISTLLQENWNHAIFSPIFNFQPVIFCHSCKGYDCCFEACKKSFRWVRSDVKGIRKNWAMWQNILFLQGLGSKHFVCESVCRVWIIVHSAVERHRVW